jgi:hypothetical protein
VPAADGSGAGGAAALGLHEGISDVGVPARHHSAVDGTLLWAPVEANPYPDPAAGGCTRWPETLRLRSSHGEVVRGRCRATNLCGYCATLAAVENSELLALDAMHGVAPTYVAILGTRTPSIDPARFYDARQLLLRAIRAKWPLAEVAALVEFTTGTGPRSGGLRRPHWNVLLKGVPDGQQEALEAVVLRSWCRNVDAARGAQYVAPIASAGGLIAYTAQHFQKQSQAPPPGWRGHRFLKSRGYLWTDTAAAREEARASLRLKRAIRRARMAGHGAHDAELLARQALELAAATTWELVDVQRALARSPAEPSRSFSSVPDV